jgi:colicin import membrane protein
MPATVPSASPTGLMPPDDSRWGGPMVLALVAHALLAAALTWGIGWNRTQTPVVAEAELWSRLPQSAAPKLVEEVPPTPPEPEPVVAKPTPPRPAPAAAQQALDAQREAQRDAQIALQQQKKREEARRDEEKRLQQEALKKKQALDREAQEKAQAKEREKLAAEKKAAEEAKRQALKDQQAKAAKDKAAKDKAAQAAAEKAEKAAEKANAERLAKERAENLKRIAGMAGATGAPSSSGTALKSSGPSATYAGRIVGAVRPNIVFTDTPVGNPTADVEVRTLPDGTIASRRLVKSSGNPAWDDAVLKALDRTARLPRDEDGRVPATLVIGFRPRD